MKKELQAEIAILSSTFLFAATAILIKLISKNFGGIFIAFCRFLIGVVLVYIVFKITRENIHISDKKNLILRGLFGSIAMVLYYVNIQITSSGRATLLTYTYPIFVAIFGYLFFDEKIKTNTLISILLCFTGILLVFYDKSTYSMIGNIVGLFSGMTSGMAIHYIKRSREKNNPLIVYLSVCIFGLFVSIFSIGQATNITFRSLLLIVLMGTLVFLAQIMRGWGLKYVTATRGSIISILVVPLTIFFSYFIGEEMKLKFFIGAVLIIIGLVINRKS